MIKGKIGPHNSMDGTPHHPHGSFTQKQSHCIMANKFSLTCAIEDKLGVDHIAINYNNSQK